ncbi:MAG: sodium-dependent bicarbonate transport family permease [Bacilli bacterium]
MQDIIIANLLSPMVLFFVIGIIAVVVNSDLKIPTAIYTGYTMIILLTIGIKGGKQLRQIEISEVIIPLTLAVFLTIFMFGVTFVLLNKVFRFSDTNALAVAAHYGSVSAVTFAAGISFLEKSNVPYEAYVSTLLVIMEGPAIILAIIFYNMKKGLSNQSLGPVVKEAFFGKSIFLLIGGLLIGLIADKQTLTLIQPVFGDMFYGLLCIFLLHMGMMAANQFGALKNQKWYTFSFAFILPIFGGLIGVILASTFGMSVGGAFMMGTLTGSASYIAAPASISHAIPEANSGIYITSALGLTLPFNLIIGLPLYYYVASYLG